MAGAGIAAQGGRAVVTARRRSPDDDPLVPDSGAAELVRRLRARGETVATAESLTAGLLSATIAGVPGASAVLRGGLVVYATDLKASLARVSETTLGRHGPVAAETASELACGAIVECGSDWGVALTGVAGPDGQDGHPPGTVFAAVAAACAAGVAGPSVVAVSRWTFVGTRWEIRLASAEHAIAMLRGAVDDRAVGPRI